MTEFSEGFRTSRRRTVAQLYELADQFEAGNRRGMKGRMTGAATTIGGVAASVGIGAMTGGASIIPTIAAEALMGAHLAAGVGAIVAGGFSIGAARKNRQRMKAVEDILKSDRREMERLRTELRPNLIDNIDAKITRIDVLYTMYSLGALGMAIPQGQISQNANVIHTIMNTGSSSITPLAEVNIDKVLEIVQGFDIPALRPAFEAIAVPGADSALEAFGEMMFHSIIDFSSIAVLPFSAVMLGLDAHKYRKKDYKKAANVVREIASNMEKTTQEMEKLQVKVNKDLRRRRRRCW